MDLQKIIRIDLASPRVYIRFSAENRTDKRDITTFGKSSEEVVTALTNRADQNHFIHVMDHKAAVKKVNDDQIFD